MDRFEQESNSKGQAIQSKSKGQAIQTHGQKACPCESTRQLWPKIGCNPARRDSERAQQRVYGSIAMVKAPIARCRQASILTRIPTRPAYCRACSTMGVVEVSATLRLRYTLYCSPLVGCVVRSSGFRVSSSHMMSYNESAASKAICEPLLWSDVNRVGTPRALEELRHQFVRQQRSWIENGVHPCPGTSIRENADGRIPPASPAGGALSTINRDEIVLQSPSRQLLRRDPALVVNPLINRRDSPLLPNKESTSSPWLTLPA
jgi:hypothetical protein